MRTCIILLLTCFLSACKSTQVDTELVVLIDKTSEMPVYPTVKDILKVLHLKEDKYRSVKVTVSVISDRELNKDYTFTLRKEITFLSEFRKEKVAQFTNELNRCLDSISNGKATLVKSLVYNRIAACANSLSKSDAAERRLLVYSDLAEHQPIADLNFYLTKTQSLLEHNPDSISNKLLRSYPVNDLTGVQINFLYLPLDFNDDLLYKRNSGFFKSLFESFHAECDISATLGN